jgi:hypothetical protein
VKPERIAFAAAPCGVGMLVGACAMFHCTNVSAQTAGQAFADPFAPTLQTDPRSPPRFQKFGPQALAPSSSPAMLTPVASGTGSTGFDSTNKRRIRNRAKLKASASAQALPADITGAITAGAPGAPPIQIGPIRKKPKAHPVPDDPYAPLGVHFDAFDLFPAVELIGGYDSNPGHEPNGPGAGVFTIAPEMRGQSNWSRHELKLDLRGSYIWYSPDETPGLSRPYLNGKIDGRVDVSQDTRVDLGGRVLVSTDNPGSPNLQAGLAKLPIYVAGGGTLGLGQTFNRFDLSIKGDIERTVYQNSTLTDGSTASNDDRNYDQYAGLLRGVYELSPGLKPFGEVAVDTRVHDLNTDFSGYQRNSNGVTGKIGAKFELTRFITGEAALGYTQRVYEDPRLANISAPVGSASLLWTVNALTNVKLAGASIVGESTIPGVSGVLYRDVGLQVDHALRQWLIASLKLGFGVDDYVGLDRVDKRYAAGFGLTYKLNRCLQVKSEFRQNWLRSNVTGVDYNESVFLVGLRLAR